MGKKCQKSLETRGFGPAEAILKADAGGKPILICFNHLYRVSDSVKQHRFIGKQRWFSGRMLACHAGGPGSIPGRCKLQSSFFLNTWVEIRIKECST